MSLACDDDRRRQWRRRQGGGVSVAGQLAVAGLGLDYDQLRLDSTTVAWVAAGAALRDALSVVLGDSAAEVEQIGSTAVVGLLAKPIIDLAVGLAPEQSLERARSLLEHEGWIYRGDAGDEGGHVFVLEDRPWHRVAHAHVVSRGGDQWANYLRLRDLLRESGTARERYASVKLGLLETSGNDREAYTTGKSDVILGLIGAR
jgi:GrpB-like predicted nucleotidyltransferase (UPF0157 family)